VRLQAFQKGSLSPQASRRQKDCWLLVAVSYQRGCLFALVESGARRLFDC